MGRPEAFYRLYERRLTRGLDPERLPRHIGVLVDGNRRWARAFGASTQQGHQAGAERILDFIGWCDEAGIPVVTLYMLSTCLLYTSPSPRDLSTSRMPSSA